MIFPLKTVGNAAGAFTVRFIVQNTVYRTVSASNGAIILKPADPQVNEYKFLGWYTGENGTGDVVDFPLTPTKNMVVYAYIGAASLIGFTGLSASSGDLTWTDDIADRPSFTTTTEENIVSVSNSLDNVFPYSELSEVTDSFGNVFVKFPRMYIRWIKNGNYLDGIKISNAPYDSDFFLPDIFKRNDGTQRDYILIGKYEGSREQNTGALCSQSGKESFLFPELSSALTSAVSTGSDYGILNLGALTLYNFLCMLYYKTANIQKVFAGRTSADNASASGTCDNVTGMNGWNTTTSCVKMLGIENPYGNMAKWIDGVSFSGSLIYKGTRGNLGTSLGFSRPTADGFVSKLSCGTSDETRSYVYANVADGTADTYTGDKALFNSDGVYATNGGFYRSGDSAGLWCFDGTWTATGTPNNGGCARLIKFEG